MDLRLSPLRGGRKRSLLCHVGIWGYNSDNSRLLHTQADTSQANPNAGTAPVEKATEHDDDAVLVGMNRPSGRAKDLGAVIR